LKACLQGRQHAPFVDAEPDAREAFAFAPALEDDRVAVLQEAAGFAGAERHGLAPLGIYLATAMLLFVPVITGLYVQRADSLFGRMNDELVEEIGL